MAQPTRVKLPVIASNPPAPVDVPIALPDLRARAAGPRRRAPDLEGRPLRTSSYVIHVDLPGDPAQQLIVHGYTGAYDRVSRRVAAYLRALEGSAPRPLHGVWAAEPAPVTEAAPAPVADETIAQLVRRGYLTAMTEDEEEERFTEMALQLQHAAVHRAPSYIVMPTYQCNLRCPYCFQDHMRSEAGNRHLLRVMDAAMVDRVFRGMDRIDAAHGVGDAPGAPRNILLFGGEPLLADSRPTIEYILRKAEARPTVLRAITNATELDAYRDLLGPGKLAQLQITLDGPPREHDRRRIYPDGSGSFERIAANITMALELRVMVSVRLNIDRDNLERLPELADEFAARGWSQHRGFSAYVAPVHDDTEHAAGHATLNSWQLSQALVRLKHQHAAMDRIGDTSSALVDRARQLFDQRADPLPRFRSNFCGAHGTMYVIDAFGDIYACWERTGDPSLRIGAIEPSGEVLINRAVLDSWRGRSVASNPVCRKCRYAMYCGGGCAVLAEQQHGQIHANHCDGFGKRFRASVADAYADHVAGVTHATSTERICDM